MRTEELDDLKQKLAGALGPDQVVDEPERLLAYATDYTEEPPGQPALVVLPTTVEQVQATLRLAAAASCTVTPRVAGSNVGGLAIPPEGGLVLDLSRMNRILQVNEQDMVALIEPGVTWEQLKAHLEKERIPLRLGYPLSPPDTSIMANCLLDGLGNLSLRYGAMADWIGGLEVVLADGRVLRTGAAALSDVWFGRGPLPDLTGLFVCWQGTTGIVTKLAFQLWPAPAHRCRLFVLLYDRKAAFRAMRDLCRMMICDDVGGLSWPTGKMLFGVQRPIERDPAEPEFFLYLDLGGQSAEELDLRRRMLNGYLQGLIDQGERLERPLEIGTLLRINPEFGKLAEFPTRLEFLVDHPGGGLSWVGTYGPLSRFERFADAGIEIMARCGMPPIIVSRPMKGGHFGVMRFISTFDKKDPGERETVRAMNRDLVQAALELGFIPYKTPPWAVAQLAPRLDPTFCDLVRDLRALLDPGGLLAPRCWPL